jgi:hypothetical protein
VRGSSRWSRAPLALAVAALAASPRVAPAGAPGDGARDELVAAARRQVGRRFEGDCSGFVLSLLRTAGVPVALAPARSRSESLYRASRRVADPRPGDLAFFHDTYDRDRDGRANDPFTHVALVEAVDGPRVLLVHRSSRGIERIRMDLARPRDREANDPVRHLRRAEPRSLKVLAGELFAGYGAIVGP